LPGTRSSSFSGIGFGNQDAVRGRDLRVSPLLGFRFLGSRFLGYWFAGSWVLVFGYRDMTKLRDRSGLASGSGERRPYGWLLWRVWARISWLW
jgi:hypothetical protein